MSGQTPECGVHESVTFHADYCHKYESGELCGKCHKRLTGVMCVRDFSSADSAWWHWGRAGCLHCEELMKQAGFDPRALADEDLACREIQRQFSGATDG